MQLSSALSGKKEMPLLSYGCPRCNRMTLIDPQGKCQNMLSNGQVCGYQIPLSYDLANRTLKSKWDKHSGPPGFELEQTLSWVENIDSYGSHRIDVLQNGTVTLRPDIPYLFLWHAPFGSFPIASVQYATAGTVTQANGIIMPLNSKLQLLHHHYGTWRSDWEVIGYGSNLIIEEPNQAHPGDYLITKPDGSEYRFSFPQDKPSVLNHWQLKDSDTP